MCECVLRLFRCLLPYTPSTSAGGDLPIFLQLQDDYFNPLHGSTREGQFSTGAANDVVLNIDNKLRPRPEFSAISQIVSGGKHVANPRERQEWMVNAYHVLSTEGFIANVTTSQGVIPNVRVRVFVVNRCCDGPKGNEDMGFKYHKCPNTLSFAMENFTATKLTRYNMSFSFSHNLDAKVRSEASAVAMAAEVDLALGTPEYDDVSSKNGMKHSCVWSTGNTVEGLPGHAHLGPHHFNPGMLLSAAIYFCSAV